MPIIELQRTVQETGFETENGTYWGLVDDAHLDIYSYKANVDSVVHVSTLSLSVLQRYEHAESLEADRANVVRIEMRGEQASNALRRHRISNPNEPQQIELVFPHRFTIYGVTSIEDGDGFLFCVNYVEDRNDGAAS